jgi:hypothetical protein
VVLPTERPVTLPDPSMVATTGLLLDHVYVPTLAVGSDKEMVLLTNTVDGPTIAPALVVLRTVTVWNPVADPHAPVAVREIVTEPEDTPVTIPVEEPTVAVPVLLLVHVPPVLPLSINAIVDPTQTVDGPAIEGVGVAFIVTVVYASHPVPMEYAMVLVPPATPVTTPVAGLTVATQV